MTTAALDQLGWTWRPRLAAAAYADVARTVHAPLVQEGEIVRPRPLEPNYIAELLAAPPPVPELENAELPALTLPTPLLHAMLLHALQLEYAWAAA